MLSHFEVRHHHLDFFCVFHRLLLVFLDVNSNDQVGELESRIAENVFIFARREATQNLTVHNNFDQLIVFFKLASYRLLQIPDFCFLGERTDSDDGIAI